MLHKFGDKLYNGLVATLTGQLKATAAKIEAVQGTPFLKELIRQWESHEKSAQMIRDILMVSQRRRPPHAQSTSPHCTRAAPLWASLRTDTAWPYADCPHPNP